MKVPGLFYNAKAVKDVPAGTVIFEEGASETEMFGIVEGRGGGTTAQWRGSQARPRRHLR